jgi:hypothetical protein
MKHFEEQKKKKQEEKLSMEQLKYSFNPQINENSRKILNKEPQQYISTSENESYPRGTTSRTPPEARLYQIKVPPSNYMQTEDRY